DPPMLIAFAHVDRSLLVDLLVSGLVSGATYALAAAGLALIYGVMEVINMAHGELYMMGAFAAYLGVTDLHLPYLLVLLFATVALGLFGLIFYDVLLRRLGTRAQFERGIVLTLGVSLILQNGAIIIFGAAPKTLTIPLTFKVFHVGGQNLVASRVYAVICAVVAFALLYLLLNRTAVGRSMRGAAQNPTAALMVGINPTRVARLTVVLGSALAGLAGCALTFVYDVHPSVGVPVVFTAFAVIIIGGLGSLTGTIITAFALGLTQSYVGGLVSTTLQDAVSFSLMMIVLFLRPQGLFGREVRL
ncbi:MAG TPA: branched-chain amino acid ABC transporter permease, partial [Gaiellaceae bacterium]|nr:branched-chain amino acid ABC transporter permease [Gaiellaceae bacterium]